MSISSNSYQPSEQQSEDRPSAEIYHRKLRSARIIVLNRLEKLNALTLDMIYQMYPQIQAWEASDLCKVIILMNPEGSKAFCAGGDIKTIALQVKASKDAESGEFEPDKFIEATKFFEEEYKLNHLIGTLKKPMIAILNGVTMGGGVGISVHGPFRIATENTLFAMPETAIGFIPDVGGSYFLPRLNGELGTYLALTGAKLAGEEVFIAGIATHYVPSARIPNLVNRLADLETDEIEAINSTIEEFVDSVSADKFKNWSLGGKVMEAIHNCFRFNTIEEIVEALEKHKNSANDERVIRWAEQTLATLMTMSPLSLKVTLEQQRKGRFMRFSDCLQMEYQLVKKLLKEHDFLEGVTAKLIEKTLPVWSPTWDEAKEISVEKIREKFFKHSESEPDLKFERPLTHYDYPHRTLSGLPTELDIYRVINGVGRRGRNIVIPQNKKEVVEWMMLHWGGYDSAMMGVANTPFRVTIEGGFGRGKMGLKEKVESVLEDRTEERNGRVEWIGPIPFDMALGE